VRRELNPTGPKRLAYLSDILVPHLADLLDICGALGDVFERVPLEDELVLLGLGDFDIDTGAHEDAAHNLLANEVPAKLERQTSAPWFFEPTGNFVPNSSTRFHEQPWGIKCPYRISTSKHSFSAFFSTLTLIGKCA
jgi:hypothetical protein